MILCLYCYCRKEKKPSKWTFPVLLTFLSAQWSVSPSGTMLQASCYISGGISIFKFKKNPYWAPTVCQIGDIVVNKTGTSWWSDGQTASRCAREPRTNPGRELKIHMPLSVSNQTWAKKKKTRKNCGEQDWKSPCSSCNLHFSCL